MAQERANNNDLFIKLYKMVSAEVNVFDGKDVREKPEWLNAKPDDADALRYAIDHGASYLPASYKDSYIRPLRKNLKLVLAQAKPSLVANIVGAVYDQGPQSGVTKEIQRFVAVISNLYRTFINAPINKDTNLQFQTFNPPLATFAFENPVKELPFPSTLPADEVRLLFLGSVGIVILPSTYRSFPVLWGALAHEVGGHDVLRVDREILPELESSILTLFTQSRDIEPNRREFLRQLWKYWIDEAASDLLGILNMGPSYALACALYAAVFNKQLMPTIIESYKGDAQRKKTLSDLRDEMDQVPILRSSPPPRFPPDNIDTHPPDVLRLYTMIGAIRGLQGLSVQCKEAYVKRIQDLIDLGTSHKNGTPRENDKGSTDITIEGYLQIASDVWISINSENGTVPFEIMKECAIEVGRHVVTAELNVLARKTGKWQNVQSWVTWTDEHEKIVETIKNLLLTSGREGPQPIANYGDDAQLLAGATCALFENPDPKFFKTVNELLGHALTKSYERDEVWGNPALARVWRPDPNS